jgi:hypothetical protein
MFDATVETKPGSNALYVYTHKMEEYETGSKIWKFVMTAY